MRLGPSEFSAEDFDQIEHMVSKEKHGWNVNQNRQKGA